MSKSYEVTAKPWEHGWELYLDGECITQVRALAKAAQQTRDYLESMYQKDFSRTSINVQIDVDGLQAEVNATREATARAAAEQAKAAEQARQVAKKLRNSGLTVADTAEVLGVSKGRVSQLTSA